MDGNKNKKPLPKQTGKTIIQFIKDAGNSILKSIKHNWQWKLVAVILAVILWGGVISQDKTVTRTKVFTNVPISNISGLYSDTVNKNGFIVTTDLLSSPPTATVTVEVPVSEYNNVTTENIDIRLLSTSISAIRETGVQTIKITPGTTIITQIQPSSLEINVESYQERSVSISTETKGSLRSDDFLAGNPESDPRTVTISGPDSIIRRAIRVAAVVDLNDVPLRYGEFGDNIPLTLRIKNDNGTYIDMPEEMLRLVNVKSGDAKINAIYVKLMVSAQKFLDVDPNMPVLTGTPAEGFEVAYYSIKQEKIQVYGTESAVEQFDEIFLDSTTLIDVSGKAAESLSPNQWEKSGNVIILNSSPNGITLNPPELIVNYKIVPIMESRTIENRPVMLEGAADGLTAALADDTISTYVNIYAAQLWLKDVKDAEVVLYADLTNLGAGVHEVPLEVRIIDREGRDTAEEVDAILTPGLEKVTVILNEK